MFNAVIAPMCFSASAAARYATLLRGRETNSLKSFDL